jgi:hypothetical protein
VKVNCPVEIIKSLIAGVPFLYQDKEGTVYHVSDNGVEANSSWGPEANVAFVDGDSEDSRPFVYSPTLRITVASSPNAHFSHG